jgi:phospholipid/cholesterol/gamma-HCH transport system substrate-binding protein
LKITKEIKTAILVIASLLLFIWGYSYLKGRDLLTEYKIFYIQYDNVEGLAISAPVTINGLVVGKVNKITLNNTTGKLVVELQIKTDFPISKSSIVNIYEPGLIGGKQIQIVPNLSDNKLAVTGDNLQGGIKKGLTDLVAEKLTPLQEKVEKLVVTADVFVKNLNSVLDAKTKEKLQNSIANLNETLIEFHSATKNVNEVINDNKSKISGAITNINKVTSDFSKVSDSISKANIGKTIKNLEQTLSKVNGILLDVQSGKGSFGKLMNDDALYSNLNKTSKEIELLLQDVRLNPTRYVNVSLFGKKNKPYVAPKIDSLKIKTK